MQIDIDFLTKAAASLAIGLTVANVAITWSLVEQMHSCPRMDYRSCDGIYQHEFHIKQILGICRWARAYPITAFQKNGS